jgi:hypothetical protein
MNPIPFMRIPRRLKRKLQEGNPLLILPLFFLVLTVVFFSRPPVLIVTDTSFIQLYGSPRFKIRQIRASLELFRRVMPVEVAESAGPDLTVLAVEGASRSPKAVLFPYRYLEAARLYSGNHPGIRVMVTGGNPSQPVSGATFGFVFTDTALDLYRAGLYAAVLAEKDSRVLFFYGDTLSDGYREAFQEGLEAGGGDNNPLYISASADYASYDGIGCVVLAGPAANFLEKNLNIPVILFSWIDPGLSPRSVKVTFDDSAWALVTGLLGSKASGDGEFAAASRIQVLKDRIGGKMPNGLIRGNFQKKEKNQAPEAKSSR